MKKEHLQHENRTLTDLIERTNKQTDATKKNLSASAQKNTRINRNLEEALFKKKMIKSRANKLEKTRQAYSFDNLKLRNSSRRDCSLMENTLFEAKRVQKMFERQKENQRIAREIYSKAIHLEEEV